MPAAGRRPSTRRESGAACFDCARREPAEVDARLVSVADRQSLLTDLVGQLENLWHLPHQQVDRLLVLLDVLVELLHRVVTTAIEIVGMLPDRVAIEIKHLQIREHLGNIDIAIVPLVEHHAPVVEWAHALWISPSRHRDGGHVLDSQGSTAETTDRAFRVNASSGSVSVFDVGH
jgi:hypothetical protein